MTFPNSGAVSLDAFVTHVDDPGITTDGDTRPHSMSEFYRKTDGPVYDLETSENDDIPASGEIKFSQLRGTRAVVTRSVTSGLQPGNPSTSHVLDHYFTSSERANKACRLIVDRDIFPGQNFANSPSISNNAQPEATSSFAQGLYLQFPMNTADVVNGVEATANTFIGGVHGSPGSAGTFPYSYSTHANDPTPGGTGGAALSAGCKVYVNPGAIKANDDTNSCFRGGGGGGGGGAIFNRGLRGNGGLWNMPNTGQPLKYRFATFNGPLGNTTFNTSGNHGNTSYNFTYNFVNDTGYAEGTVSQYRGNPSNGNQNPYSTPSGADSGNVVGYGYPGTAGANDASWALNNPPNSGSAGQIQIWNSGNPINDIYNTSPPLGLSGSSNPWAHFPYGSQIRYLGNHVYTGPGAHHPPVALGISAHYGYPIAKIVYINKNYNFTNGYEVGNHWYHSSNIGGTNTNPSGHFNVLQNANPSNPGNMYQAPTVVADNIPNLTGTIRPAASGGSQGVQFSTTGSGAVNTGDVTSVE